MATYNTFLARKLEANDINKYGKLARGIELSPIKYTSGQQIRDSGKFGPISPELVDLINAILLSEKESPDKVDYLYKSPDREVIEREAKARKTQRFRDIRKEQMTQREKEGSQKSQGKKIIPAGRYRATSATEKVSQKTQEKFEDDSLGPSESSGGAMRRKILAGKRPAVPEKDDRGSWGSLFSRRLERDYPRTAESGEASSSRTVKKLPAKQYLDNSKNIKSEIKITTKELNIYDSKNFDLASQFYLIAHFLEIYDEENKAEIAKNLRIYRDLLKYENYIVSGDQIIDLVDSETLVLISEYLSSGKINTLESLKEIFSDVNDVVTGLNSYFGVDIVTACKIQKMFPGDSVEDIVSNIFSTDLSPEIKESIILDNELKKPISLAETEDIGTIINEEIMRTERTEIVFDITPGDGFLDIIYMNSTPVNFVNKIKKRFVTKKLYFGRVTQGIIINTKEDGSGRDIYIKLTRKEKYNYYFEYIFRSREERFLRYLKSSMLEKGFIITKDGLFDLEGNDLTEEYYDEYGLDSDDKILNLFGLE